MTQATAVAVHFYSLLMTWGQAGSTRTQAIQITILGAGFLCLCIRVRVCVFLSFGLMLLKCSVLKGNRIQE